MSESQTPRTEAQVMWLGDYEVVYAHFSRQLELELKEAKAPVWICGKADPISPRGWEFQGVFGSEELAISACRDGNYFIGPALIGEALPHESIEWPGAYYPKSNKQTQEKK